MLKVYDENKGKKKITNVNLAMRINRYFIILYIFSSYWWSKVIVEAAQVNVMLAIVLEGNWSVTKSHV